MLTKLLTGRAATPRDNRVQNGTRPRHPPSSKAWKSVREHRPTHRVGDLGPGVLGRGGSNPPARTPPPTSTFATPPTPRVSRRGADAHGLLTKPLWSRVAEDEAGDLAGGLLVQAGQDMRVGGAAC
jgi:hypothetical protein